MSKKNGDMKIKGKDYWRSLDQLADTPEFNSFLKREFPLGASEFDNSWSRRKFLTLMGASLAMAGLASCRRPVEKIVPYVERPEEVIPGVPLYYATSMPFSDHAFGLVVESHEGRPTKIEGNKLHSSTLGAASAIIQAQTLSLFDPDRSKKVLKGQQEKSWNDFVLNWIGAFEKFKENKGAGLSVLSGMFSSPTLSRLKKSFDKNFPKARWLTYEAVSDENIYNGTKAAFGKSYRPNYSFDKARVVLSLDSDFLLTESDSIKNARGFAAARNVETEKDEMNRLYVVESGYSTTGANADHRQAISSGDIGAFALNLANALNNLGINVAGTGAQLVSDKKFKWVNELARDLAGAKGASLVVAGRRQPAAVHALAAAINDALGNIGKTVEYSEVSDTSSSDSAGLQSLVADMNSGSVSTLIMFGSNPVYDAPAELGFAAAMSKVKTTIHFNDYVDETGQLTTWHVPKSHFLESWGDTRSYDGTRGLTQPLIRPLFGSVSESEMMGLLAEGKFTKGYDLVRQTWKNKNKGGNFESRWRKILHDGLEQKSAYKSESPGIRNSVISKFLRDNPLTNSSGKSGMEIIFRSSPSLYDGRYATNGWLQELAHPISKLTWDNVAYMSNADAKSLGVKNNDVVKLELAGRSLELPVWIQPGQAKNSVVVELGYGRKGAFKVGDGVGGNVNLLKNFSVVGFAAGLKVTKMNRTHALACTQDHWSMEGRAIVREASLQEYRKHPKFAEEAVQHKPLESVFDEHSYAEGYQWGMTVDLNSCVGCNACMIACQSENNIPIVGKEQVANGREMNWIRLDRYYSGDVEDPETVHQIILCQHCENAPCETVCPVNATMHDAEGLNVMVYNRCIGTRYCSNNCPYKVRRFNFFNYTKDYSEIEKMTQNPDVTVRFRGVMEKCTYCIQRISAAKIEAKNNGKKVVDGDITTACQQACPVDALTFGDINDAESRVSKKKKFNRNYALLSELNVKPRTTYLAKIRNPNSNIKKA